MIQKVVNAIVNDIVILLCPVCNRTRLAVRENGDPKNSFIVVCGCDECNLDDESVSYYDVYGDQILLG
jgi:hypothetical protein